jgi:hypothetical protein
MFVMVISLLLFSLFGWPNLLWRILSRIVLIPVIAGLSYELLKVAGKGTSRIVKILSVPGLLLQYLTTKEPTRPQLEVAIAALKAVLVAADAPLIEGICDKGGVLITGSGEDGDAEQFGREHRGGVRSYTAEEAAKIAEEVYGKQGL